MATHPNNVEAAIEHKRVSFGGEEHVQMIVYDDGLTDDYNTTNKYSSRHSTAFTEPDAPPSRVKVTAETAQFPRPISPPAQIGPSTMSHYHQPTTTETIATDHAVAGGSGMPSSTVGLPSSTTVVTSPPLPSFVKRAEHDNENPFRPEEHLYHEVDPIVEAYRQRPFPPSPTHGSPVSNSHQHQQQQQQTTSTTTTWNTPTKRNSTTQPQHQLQYQQQLQYANGGSGRLENGIAQ
ncbi:hypothetical protein niasHT_025541 [Heterodera trifolii]|uniref:Uncharacterized protein n=1 Tax=Heterodera trifolii TaxID=157864 RepID=A0ABD2J8X6_9BILA